MRAKTSAAASSRRVRWTSRRTSRGGACRPRGTLTRSAIGPESMIRAPMKRWFLLLIPLIGLAGCAPSGAGGVDTGRFKGDAKAVAQTLDDLTTAGRKKDGQRACAELLSHRRVHALDKA